MSADGGRRPATREEIFISQGVEHLACRHADPAAAIGAHEAAWSGATVAFADPLGMYLIGAGHGPVPHPGRARPRGVGEMGSRR